MSEVELIKNLLTRDWNASISGRSNDVPDPTASPARLKWVLQKKQRDARLKTRDVGYVASGADTSYTPQGLGWNDQEIDTAVVVEYRAAKRTNTQGSVYSDPHQRLVGARTGADGVAAPDDWDGIVGETLRVVLAQRKGVAEFDRLGLDGAGQGIRVSEFPELGGKNYYRVDVWVPANVIADSIDTST